MAVIVISATIEVAYVVAINIFEPPGFFIGVEDLFQLFGLFLWGRCLHDVRSFTGSRGPLLAGSRRRRTDIRKLYQQR